MTKEDRVSRREVVSKLASSFSLPALPWINDHDNVKLSDAELMNQIQALMTHISNLKPFSKAQMITFDQ